MFIQRNYSASGRVLRLCSKTPSGLAFVWLMSVQCCLKGLADGKMVCTSDLKPSLFDPEIVFCCVIVFVLCCLLCFVWWNSEGLSFHVSQCTSSVLVECKSYIRLPWSDPPTPHPPTIFMYTSLNTLFQQLN